MSLQCDWLLLCERVLEDTQSGHLTFVNCLDQLTAWSAPSTLPGFAFAARFSRAREGEGDGRYEIRLQRQGATGPEETVVHLEGELKPGADFLRVFVNFAVIRVFRAEQLRFRIDWRKAGQRWRQGPTVPIRIALPSAELGAQFVAEASQVYQQLAASRKE